MLRTPSTRREVTVIAVACAYVVLLAVATRLWSYDLWGAVLAHRAYLEADGRLERRRDSRLREELRAMGYGLEGVPS